MNLAPWETVFVVFPKAAPAPSRTAPAVVETALGNIDGPWQVSFPPDLGAPASATFEKLTPWNENAKVGIKYLSGTAAYAKSINVPASWIKPGAHIRLDLGSVNLADVFVNGKDLAILWTEPFCTDITSALKPGENKLEVKITNAGPIASSAIAHRTPSSSTRSRLPSSTRPVRRCGHPACSARRS